MKKGYAAANKRKRVLPWIRAESRSDTCLCQCDCRDSFIYGIYLDGFIRSRRNLECL